MIIEDCRSQIEIRSRIAIATCLKVESDMGIKRNSHPVKELPALNDHDIYTCVKELGGGDTATVRDYAYKLFRFNKIAIQQGTSDGSRQGSYLLAYRESTHTILRVTCPYSKCNQP